jgi:hypothetical protein
MDNLLNYYIIENTPKKCLCSANILNCFDENCNYCIHKDLIYRYCPFLQIITNSSNIKPNIFDIRKNYYINTDGDTRNFNLFRHYLLRWGDTSKDYNKTSSIVIALSLYNIIINNRIIIECMYYIYEPFVNDMITLLKLTLNSPDYNNNLKNIFQQYFINTPDENINVMYNWLNILENITDFNHKSDLFYID